MINVENIKIKYEENEVIKDVSFNVPKGAFVTILGANGSGKSSIIKAIAGNLEADDGKILLFDEVVNQSNKKSLSKKIAYLLQFNDSIDNITVFDFVAYGRTPHKSLFSSQTQEDIDIINRALFLTSLTLHKDRLMTSLSGGEKQRVYLAMCLAQEPEVLILDEPTNHLDIKFQYQTLSLIKEINRKTGMTVLCVLHDLNQAIKYSDYMVFIKDGHVYKQGTPEECITPDLVKGVFDIECEVFGHDESLHVDYVV